MSKPSFQLRTGGLEILYTPVDRKLVQQRLEGRLVLAPDVDLSGFRAEAVIDWINIGVILKEPTQFRYIKDVIGRTGAKGVFVKPLERKRESCRHYRITIQHPFQGAAIARAIEAVRGAFTVEATSVEGLEVSLDLYPRRPDRLNRHKLLAVVQRHLWVDPAILVRSGALRQIWESPDDPDDFRTLIVPSSTNRVWDFGTATTYAGREGGPIAFRIQDKVTDRRRRDKKTGKWLFDQLHEKDHRVRVEVTLTGVGLAASGYADLESVLRGEFQSLKKFFRFVLPSVPIGSNPMFGDFPARQDWRKFQSGGVCIFRHMEAAKEVDRQRIRRDRERMLKLPRLRKAPAGEMGPLARYVELDDMIRQALRNLSCRWIT